MVCHRNNDVTWKPYKIFLEALFFDSALNFDSEDLKRRILTRKSSALVDWTSSEVWNLFFAVLLQNSLIHFESHPFQSYLCSISYKRNKLHLRVKMPWFLYIAVKAKINNKIWYSVPFTAEIDITSIIMPWLSSMSSRPIKSIRSIVAHPPIL